MNLKKWIPVLFSVAIIALVGCKDERKIPAEIANIPVDIHLHRFDQEFKNLDTTQLKKLQNEFPFLFSNQVTNEFWIKKSKDSLQLELAHEVHKVFPTSQTLEMELEDFYKYLKFHYNQIKAPKVISLIGEVDYKNRVVLTKELLLISLDSYLGKEHFFYEDIQKYIREDFEKSHVVIDVAQEYARKIVPRPDDRDFLSQMILFGKRRFLLQQLLPQKSLAEIMEYNTNEWQWASENESFIWRYFIEKDMLYNTDKELLPRFIYPAPFSKFYLEIDSQSSDRIGQFIGYKIVLAFMERNNVSLQQMLEMNSKSLFQASKYKPKK